MTNDIRHLSVGFQRLYCEANIFEAFSVLHPISFKRVLPFRTWDTVVDDPHVIFAEQAHLADRSDNTRLAVVDAYARCGLLQQAEAADLKFIIDYFATDFFDVMGQTYANMGMLRCALRWYRELIQILETGNPDFALGRGKRLRERWLLSLLRSVCLKRRLPGQRRASGHVRFQMPLPRR